MKNWECVLIIPEAISRDVSDVIDKAASRIGHLVGADCYLFAQLTAGHDLSLSYSSRARFLVRPQIAYRLVELCGDLCFNLPSFKNNFFANKL